MLSEAELQSRIDALLRADDFGVTVWHTSGEPVLTFTYQFETTKRSDYQFEPISNLSAYTTAEKAAVRTALAKFEDVLNIRFTEVTGQADPDFSFYNASDFSGNTAGIGGWGYSGGNWDGQAIFRASINLAEADQMGLLLHEIGHALGLKHPGNYGGGTAPFLPAGEDSEKYTVMSYNSNPDTGLASRNLMLYDIAALQEFWGANLNVRTGDDIYTGPDDGRLQVVWDNGGFDSIKHTGAGNARIDLREGTFSRLGSAEDNFAVAYGVIIENAAGNAGNDTLTGNDVANTLTALAGNDTLYGGAGDDTLIGGAGADQHYGGAGEDWVRYASSALGVVVDLTSGTGNGGDAAGDTFAGIEHVVGSNAGDRITGDGGVNRLDGLGGDDTIFGGGGDDILNGGAGADSLDGGSGFDTVDYSNNSAPLDIGIHRRGSGHDAEGDTLSGIERIIGSNFGDVLIGGLSGSITLDGGTGADLLYDYGANAVLIGGAGVDTLSGGAGNDTLFGGDLTDFLFGGAGADMIDGGDGSDYLSFSNIASGVVFDLGAGTGTGGEAAGDTYTSIENAYGSQGADGMTGDGAFNRLFGLDGADTINGGGGNDYLFGGEGSDVFVFETGWGRDLILDWEDGIDRLDIRSTGLTLADFTEVDSPQGVRLDWFDGTSVLAIHLFGTNAAGQNLSPDDITLADFLV